MRTAPDAKVEAAVLIAQRQILAALRDQKFFHLDALNSALRAKVVELNAQPFQKLSGSRDSWFQAQEKSALLPLPSEPYVLALWEKAKVNIDYHVAVDKHYYSAPHSFIHQELDVRVTETTVELFHQAQRVAAHARSFAPGQFTTLEEHRPKSHQKYLHWTSSRMIHWAGKIGPACAQLVGAHPQKPPSSRDGISIRAGHHAPGAKASERLAWKRPAAAPCTLAPVPIGASNGSGTISWIAATANLQ